MTPILIGVFVIGLAIGLPIAFVMGVSSLAALAWEGKLSMLSVPQRVFDGINSFPLMAVPFFILAADLMTASGITTALLRFSQSIVGHIRGGLGHVNVVTSVLFAGISGSAVSANTPRRTFIEPEAGSRSRSNTRRTSSRIAMLSVSRRAPGPSPPTRPSSSWTSPSSPSTTPRPRACASC